MRRTRVIAEAGLIVTLCLWLAALLASGAMAAALFPWLKQLDPALPGFSNYTGEHWKLAAGLIAQRFFAIADLLQLICASVCVVCYAVIVIDERGRPLPAKRELLIQTLLIGLAWILAAYELLVLGPRMTANFRGLVNAAAAGENSAAAAFQQAFSTDHPAASRVLASTAAAVLALLIAKAVFAARKTATARE